MTKPTAAQVWRRLVEEAGEDQIAAVLSMSQEQVDAELAGAGFHPEAEREGRSVPRGPRERRARRRPRLPQ